MRELEFLPDWYPKLRQRKHFIAFQCWIVLIIVAGLGSWIGLSVKNARAASKSLDALRHQLDQKHTEQRILGEQLALRKELQDREQMIASLGFPVEMTRLLQTLDGVMPKEMSLLEFNCDTEELARPASGVAVARATQDKDPARQMDRRLKVRLVAVAPSDVDLANFLAGLTNVPFFEQVAVNYTHDKTDAGHLMREFEVTFSVSLNRSALGN